MTEVRNDADKRALRLKVRQAVLDAMASMDGEARRDMILERALADGGFSARELASPPPASADEKHQSLVGYELSWALTNLKRDGLVENPQRGHWRLTDAGLPSEESAVEEPVAAERLAKLRSMPYPFYLRTPEWRRTRAAALVRAGNACSLDVTHTRDLEVHHRTYERRGEELVTDLIVLCHSCHQLHHKAHGLPRKESGRKHRRFGRWWRGGFDSP
jgi:restriction endonuclease Mrr